MSDPFMKSLRCDTIWIVREIIIWDMVEDFRRGFDGQTFNRPDDQEAETEKKIEFSSEVRKKIERVKIAFDYLFHDQEGELVGVEPGEKLKYLNAARDLFERYNANMSSFVNVEILSFELIASLDQEESDKEREFKSDKRREEIMDYKKELNIFYKKLLEPYLKEFEGELPVWDENIVQGASSGPVSGGYAYTYDKRRREFKKKWLKKVFEITGLKEKEKQLIEQLESANTPEILSGFEEQAKLRILKNAFAIEMTSGCSVACTFCGFDAPRKVSKVMEFGDLTWITRRTNRNVLMYYATDPLDYLDETGEIDRDYEDVLNVYEVTHDRAPFTSTAVPKRRLDVLDRVKSRVDRLSISKMNQRRLIDGGYVERETDQSLLFVDPGFFEGRKEIETYYFPDNALEQGRNRGEIRGHVDAHAKSDKIADSISCKDGVVITPSMIKNSVKMNSSKGYPTGVGEGIITPESLQSGYQKLKDFMKRPEESVSINQILPHIIIEFSGFQASFTPKIKPEYRKLRKRGQTSYPKEWVAKQTFTKSFLVKHGEKDVFMKGSFLLDVNTGKVSNIIILDEDWTNYDDK